MTTILLTTLVALALGFAGAMPQTSSKDATIVDQTNNFNGIDPWKWSFRASDGTIRQEAGAIINGVVNVIGNYLWRSPSGDRFAVSYKADQNGFQSVMMPVNETVELPKVEPQLLLGTNTALSLIGK